MTPVGSTLPFPDYDPLAEVSTGTPQLEAEVIPIDRAQRIKALRSDFVVELADLVFGENLSRQIDAKKQFAAFLREPGAFPSAIKPEAMVLLLQRASEILSDFSGSVRTEEEVVRFGQMKIPVEMARPVALQVGRILRESLAWESKYCTLLNGAPKNITIQQHMAAELKAVEATGEKPPLGMCQEYALILLRKSPQLQAGELELILRMADRIEPAAIPDSFTTTARPCRAVYLRDSSRTTPLVTFREINQNSSLSDSGLQFGPQIDNYSLLEKDAVLIVEKLTRGAFNEESGAAHRTTSSLSSASAPDLTLAFALACQRLEIESAVEVVASPPHVVPPQAEWRVYYNPSLPMQRRLDF